MLSSELSGYYCTSLATVVLIVPAFLLVALRKTLLCLWRLRLLDDGMMPIPVLPLCFGVVLTLSSLFCGAPDRTCIPMSRVIFVAGISLVSSPIYLVVIFLFDLDSSLLCIVVGSETIPLV